MTTKPLTPKQAQFVAEYLKDKNGAEACRRAGYAPKHANSAARDLMARPEVKRAIARALRDQQLRTLQSADLVLLNIQHLAERAGKAGEFHAAIRGWELLGRHYKLFTDKHEHGGIGGGAITLTITDKEADL